MNQTKRKQSDRYRKQTNHWEREEGRSNIGIEKIKSVNMRLCEFMCVKLLKVSVQLSTIEFK